MNASQVLLFQEVANTSRQLRCGKLNYGKHNKMQFMFKDLL